MIINESNKLNERAIDLGNGASAYSYGGKYYLKKGDTKKEISQNQYTTLLNGKTADKDLEKYKQLKKDQDYVDNKIKQKGFDKNLHRAKSYRDRADQKSKLAKDINNYGDMVTLTGTDPTQHIYSQSDKSKAEMKTDLYKINKIAGDRVQELAMKYQPDAQSLNDLTKDNARKVYLNLRKHYIDERKKYGDDAEIPTELYDLLEL